MNKIALIVTMVGVSILGFSGASFADFTRTLPADPTGGAMATAETSIQTWVLTYGVPVLVTLTVLGILIRLALKWIKRAGSRV
jgi:hypothetical protein